MKNNLLNWSTDTKSFFILGLNGTPPAFGKVRDVEKFDTTFFGIHRRLSNFMDPQNRLILERSFEAIIDSGNINIIIHYTKLNNIYKTLY